MEFLVTEDANKTDKCIYTDDYTLDEIIRNIHIKNIKQDITRFGLKMPVRVYPLIDGKTTKYTLLS